MRRVIVAIATVALISITVVGCTFSSAVTSDVIEYSIPQVSELTAPILWIDVREPWEHEQDNIAGSFLIPLSEITTNSGIAQIQALAQTMFAETGQEPVVMLYCERGIRSARAQRQLAAANIEAISLAGGIQAWREVYPKN